MQRTMLVAAVVVLVAVAGVGGAAAADAPATQEDVVAIELSVTTPGNEPIGQATATIEWDGGSTTATTVSNGRAFAEVPQGATLEITLEHESYVKNVRHTVADVSADQVVETTMYEAATGAVTVVDGDGPVEGATVRLRKEGQSVFAARGDTGSDGTYSSGEVEVGTYTVIVREPGYYHATRTVELQGAANTTVEIEQGKVTVDLFVQDPTPAGAGALSADVNVTYDGQSVVRVTTDDQGRQSVLLDVNRDFDVRVSDDGYRTLSAGLRTGESDMQTTFNITRVPTISLTAGNEQVVVGENLRVSVTDEYDRPVEGATVLVDGEPAGQTGADGVARVTIDSEGEVQVSAAYEDLNAEPATVTGVSASSNDGANNDTDEGDDDGGTGDGSPGFGVVAALVGVLAAVAALARRH